MTSRTSRFFSFVVLASLAIFAQAQDVDPQPPVGNVDASLYGESVLLPREAALCAEHVDGYAARFQALYDRWRAENAKQIADGNSVLHASTAKAGADADAEMAKLGNADVERLRKISPELLARHCALILESLAPPPN